MLGSCSGMAVHVCSSSAPCFDNRRAEEGCSQLQARRWLALQRWSWCSQVWHCSATLMLLQCLCFLLRYRVVSCHVMWSHCSCASLWGWEVTCLQIVLGHSCPLTPESTLAQSPAPLFPSQALLSSSPPLLYCRGKPLYSLGRWSHWQPPQLPSMSPSPGPRAP